MKENNSAHQGCNCYTQVRKQEDMQLELEITYFGDRLAD